jgi:phage nucleotide-binding protein
MAIVKKTASPPSNPLEKRIKPVHMLESAMAALFYGRPGTGKTTVAATFPKPALLVDVKDKGTDSISNVAGIDVLAVESWDDIEDVYWMLADGKSKYKTVILDPVSTLQDVAMVKTMEDDGKKPGDAIAQRNWGNCAGLMKTWITNYRDLIDQGINVVFLAHDRATAGDEDDDGALDPTVGARLMPSVASFLNGAVGVIGNTIIREHTALVNNKKVRTAEYAMRLGPHAFYTTKMRNPTGTALPDVLSDPTYDKLVAIMRGDWKPPTPPKLTVIKKGK